MNGLLSTLLTELCAENTTKNTDSVAVSHQQLTALLSCARVAPSADNSQTWRFITIRSPSTRKALSQLVSPTIAPFVAEASVVIVACGVPALISHVRREQPFVMIDVPIAITHIVLRATEMQIPYVWTLDCDETAMRAQLGIPAHARVIGLIALGRASE